MRAASLLVLVLAAAVPLVGARAAEPAADADATQTVVLLTQAGPVLLRLRLLVDGRPFNSVRRAAEEDYLLALFRHLDADGDGSLSEREARRMPAPVRLSGNPSQPATNVAFNFRVVDADGDGRISPAELAAYHREYGGGAVSVRTLGRPGLSGGVNERLFA